MSLLLLFLGAGGTPSPLVGCTQVVLTHTAALDVVLTHASALEVTLTMPQP